MKLFENIAFSCLTQWVKTLQYKLHHYDGVWLRCNYYHFAQLRLALHHHSGTLYPVQLRILG